MNDPEILKWESFFEQSYGLDYNLINGRRYINAYPTAEGHPFLGEDRFYRANIVINQIEYSDVEIKYDICNQKILLQYPYFSGNKDIIILNEEFINEFRANGRLFKKFNIPGMGPLFCQVVSQGDIYCLYHWEKDLLKGLSKGNYFQYSAEKHLSYLVLDNKLTPFKGKKSFLNLLPQKYIQDIKSYLRSNQIWIRDASDIQMRHLMDYCNLLISQN